MGNATGKRRQGVKTRRGSIAVPAATWDALDEMVVRIKLSGTDTSRNHEIEVAIDKHLGAFKRRKR